MKGWCPWLSLASGSRGRKETGTKSFIHSYGGEREREREGVFRESQHTWVYMGCAPVGFLGRWQGHPCKRMRAGRVGETITHPTAMFFARQREQENPRVVIVIWLLSESGSSLACAKGPESERARRANLARSLDKAFQAFRPSSKDNSACPRTTCIPGWRGRPTGALARNFWVSAETDITLRDPTHQLVEGRMPLPHPPNPTIPIPPPPPLFVALHCKNWRVILLLCGYFSFIFGTLL